MLGAWTFDSCLMLIKNPAFAQVADFVLWQVSFTNARSRSNRSISVWTSALDVHCRQLNDIPVSVAAAVAHCLRRQAEVSERRVSDCPHEEHAGRFLLGIISKSVRKQMKTLGLQIGC